MRELLLNACRVLFMQHPTEGGAKQTPGARRDEDGQKGADADEHENSYRCEDGGRG